MDNISKSSKTIKEIYANLSYFDQYGGSVMTFILLLLILFIIVSYTVVMRNFQPIKDDWVNQRCKPQVLPFAGLINKPDNISVVDFTGQNFTYCMQNILIGITGEAVQPITYLTLAIKEVFNVIADTIQYIRTMLSSIRSNMTSIAQEILGRVANIMVPIQQILISFRDAMNKVKGVLTAGLYTSLGSYYALKAMMGAIVQMIIIILITLVGIIISMWIIPFTWPVAASMTAIFISISIPLAIIVGFMSNVLHINGGFSIPSVPPKPACFDENTQLTMNDGTFKKISDVRLGDILKNNNKITAIMILDSNNQIMYNLNNILVSASHQVKYNNKWINVSNHKDSKFIGNCINPFLYCINTSSKIIEINGNIFLDWDELDEKSIRELLKPEQSVENIHNFYDGGFVGITEILKMDGSVIPIKKIKPGDILDKNIKVIGIVELDNSYFKSMYQYNLGNGQLFYGNINLHICDKNLDKKFVSNKTLIEKTKDNNKLYHLITQEQFFYVNNIKFYHYNSNIELLLQKYRINLLSIKYV